MRTSSSRTCFLSVRLLNILIFFAYSLLFIVAYIGGLNVRERFLSINLMKLTGVDGIVKLKILNKEKCFVCYEKIWDKIKKYLFK